MSVERNEKLTIRTADPKDAKRRMVVIAAILTEQDLAAKLPNFNDVKAEMANTMTSGGETIPALEFVLDEAFMKRAGDEAIGTLLTVSEQAKAIAFKMKEYYDDPPSHRVLVNELFKAIG